MKVQSTFYIDFISKTVDILLISSFITKQMPKLLIFDAFTLLICKKNVAIYALLRCKIFSLKIWLCKFFDKFHVCSLPSERILLFLWNSVFSWNGLFSTNIFICNGRSLERNHLQNKMLRVWILMFASRAGPKCRQLLQFFIAILERNNVGWCRWWLKFASNLKLDVVL